MKKGSKSNRALTLLRFSGPETAAVADSGQLPGLVQAKQTDANLFGNKQRQRIGLHQPAAKPVKALALRQPFNAIIVRRRADRLIDCSLQANAADGNQQQRRKERAAFAAGFLEMRTTQRSGGVKAIALGTLLFETRNIAIKINKI